VSVLLSVLAGVGSCRPKPQPVTPTPAVNTPQSPPTTRSDPDSARRAREAEEARLREELARLRSTLEQMVFFDYDIAQIRSDARTTLDAKVPILRQRSDIRLLIEGHADERGSIEYNLALGMRRAENVRSYLVNFGIPADRLDVATYGEERPISTGSDESAFARNRRAEFRIIAGLTEAEEK
jgi:peptidoglycan-associated lipoprotein